MQMTKEQIEKIATLISESGKAAKYASSVAQDALKDNEELARENAMLKKAIHDDHKERQVEKIAGMLKQNGLVSKTAMPEKIAELTKMSDELLDNLECTLHGLSGTQSEKLAAEGTLSTFDFMHDSLYNEVEAEDDHSKRTQPKPFYEALN